MNNLFYGGNLGILRKFIRNETIDLCSIAQLFSRDKSFGIIEQFDGVIIPIEMRRKIESKRETA